VPDRGDARRVLGHALPAGEARRAVVAGARIDLRETVAHRRASVGDPVMIAREASGDAAGEAACGRSKARRARVCIGFLKKKNPAVGAPGQSFLVIGVYGFKYAAWLWSFRQ